MIFESPLKISAGSGTAAITLIPETKFGESHPLNMALTSVVVTFPSAAPATEFFGSGADGRRFRVRLEVLS